jgi:single-strand DNA-binding protein
MHATLETFPGSCQAKHQSQRKGRATVPAEPPRRVKVGSSEALIYTQRNYITTKTRNYMSMSFNEAILAGNITRDPEVRFTPTGVQVVDASIALNHSWRGEDGTKREEVSYIDLVFWNKLAEVAGNYLKKGSQVLVSGRLKQETWDDRQTGQKRSKIKVIVETLKLLSKPEGPTASPTPARAAKPATRPDKTAPASQPAGNGGDDGFGDDVPF